MLPFEFFLLLCMWEDLSGSLPICLWMYSSWTSGTVFKLRGGVSLLAAALDALLLTGSSSEDSGLLQIADEEEQLRLRLPTTMSSSSPSYKI